MVDHLPGRARRRYCPEPPISEAAEAVRAEFASAVADDWQCRRPGRALLERLARHARAYGLRWLDGAVPVDNEPMFELLARLGATLRAEPGDDSVVQAQLAV